MKRLLTILLLIVSANVFGQLQPQPSGTLTPLTTNQAYFRASDSTYYFYNGTNYLWNYFLNKQQADKLYQPINSPSATPFSLSTGYGLVGSSFNGSVARTWTADTASVNGLVSKSRLATNLGGYIPSSRTITINGATRDLSTNRTWNVGTVTSVGATPGTGISVTGSPITSSGNITITNTAPDQTVVLTAGTGISTSGTYPNFTITNTSPSPSGLQDSLTKKANRTFDNVASGAIVKAKADTSANGLLPKSNLFPLGDTRYVKKSGDTMTGTLNGTDIVLSDNITATGLNSTGQATLGSLNQGGKMNFVSGGTGAVGGTLGFSTNATTNILSLQNIQGLELTSTNSNGYVAVRATGANGAINFRTGSNINGYVHPSGNWSFQNGGTYTDNGYRIDVNGTGRFTSALTANSFVKSGGTSAQFLMGNGTIQDTTQIQTVANFFPKGDTRYVKKSGDTMTGTLNGTDIVLSGNFESQKVMVRDTLFIDNTNATLDMDAAENINIIMDRGANSFKNLITLETSATKNWEFGTRPNQTGFSIYNNMTNSQALKIDSLTNSITLGSLKMSDWLENTVSTHKDFNYLGVQKYRMRNDGIMQSQYGFEAYKDGSNTFGIGSYLGVWNTAGNRGWLSQLNASNGLDWWYFNGSSGSVKASLDVNGNLTANNFTSGTYTPTLTNGTNVSSSTSQKAYYQRVGNIVTVSGSMVVTPTSTGNTRIDIALPIASALVSNQDLAGQSTGLSGVATEGLIYADGTNDRAQCLYIVNSASAQQINYSFSYEIL